MLLLRPRASFFVLAACLIALAVFAADTIHTVVKGDTLSGIASRYGTSVTTLRNANRLADADELQIGQKIRIPIASPPDAASSAAKTPAATGRTHTVRPGETLSEIAARHRTSSEAIARANGIQDPRSLQVGTVLKLPAAPKDTAVVEAKTTPLPSSIARQLKGIRVAPSKWRYIVVHHSATSVGSARNMELYHRNTRGMENGLAYHFVIGNGRGMGDGEIAIGSRWRKQIQGGHLASERLNQISIGICLVGNFELGRPTERQLKALYALVNDLEERCGTPANAVRTHRQINTKPTECPGRLFPTESLLNNT